LAYGVEPMNVCTKWKELPFLLPAVRPAIHTTATVSLIYKIVQLILQLQNGTIGEIRNDDDDDSNYIKRHLVVALCGAL